MNTAPTSDAPSQRIGGRFVPIAAPGVTTVEAEREAVLVDADRAMHLLNPTSALLWECFDGASSVAEICGDVADAVGVPFERAFADAVRLIEDLAGLGLVVDAREYVDTTVRPERSPAPRALEAAADP